MIIGSKEFKTGHTHIMGILNVTPDSFSDGGKYSDLDKALFRMEAMEKEGADLIDIGGESTRPGAEKISEAEELSRVLPVIEAAKARFDLPISLDTYKASVARDGLSAGADLINDISGLSLEPKLGRVVADFSAAYCLTHNHSGRAQAYTYSDFAHEMEEDLDRAFSLGIPKDKILIDPGIGFHKSAEDNLLLLGNLKKMQDLGYPILLGASRKSVIDAVLHLPTEERLYGTLATTAAAVRAGCLFVRVHDIKENAQMIKMLEAIAQYE